MPHDSSRISAVVFEPVESRDCRVSQLADIIEEDKRLAAKRRKRKADIRKILDVFFFGVTLIAFFLLGRLSGIWTAELEHQQPKPQAKPVQQIQSWSM